MQNEGIPLPLHAAVTCEPYPSCLCVSARKLVLLALVSFVW